MRMLRGLVLVGGVQICGPAGATAAVVGVVRVAVATARPAVAAVLAGLFRRYVAIVPAGLLALRPVCRAADRQGQACGQRPAYG